MPINFDTALGVHEQALYSRARRAEVLGSNIANVDTPGYKARDIDFREALGKAQQNRSISLANTQSGHISAADNQRHIEAGVKYRNPYQPSQDGNTVELHIEQAQFADNAIRYQSTLTFLGSKFSGLKNAITGGR
ncbi:flagellar basal body rod protein FlgB [Litorivivens sp.]|uniref:flagellar basal body rod protein FlgB n=3 Tax=Litorivivens sp. TaxID=2020868 RepID=UPI003565AA6A